MKKKHIYIITGVSKAIEYGLGTYIYQLITALKDSGWKFHIVHLYTQGDEVEVLEKGGYEQINIPRPNNYLKSAIHYYFRNIVFLLKEFIPEDNGTEIIFQLNFMADSCFVYDLKKHFRCKIILVVHYTEWSFMLLGDAVKLKKILYIPEKELKKFDEKFIAKVFNDNLRMINKVDRLVCVAQHTQDIFHEIGNIPIRKTVIINNAIEDTYKPLSIKEKLYLRSKYYLDSNTRIILFAGRLEEVKGGVFVIKAFNNIVTTHPDTRLLIAGDGESFGQLLKESSGFWMKIAFTGRLDKEQLYELYSIADIGVVCSLHEEFGLTAIEMMMNAIPVIVTKTSGLDEIVEDTVSGLKISVRKVRGKRQVDVKKLGEKICFLLDNPSLAKEIGEKGRKRFLEKFELSIFKEKMSKLYDTI
jgi:glycosyltransferase